MMKKEYIQPSADLIFYISEPFCARSVDQDNKSQNPLAPISSEISDQPEGDESTPARYDAWATWDDMGWE